MKYLDKDGLEHFWNNLDKPIGENVVKYHSFTDPTTTLKLELTFIGDEQLMVAIAPRLAQVVMFYSTLKTTGTYALPNGDPINFRVIAQAFVDVKVIEMLATYMGETYTFANVTARVDSVGDNTRVTGSFGTPAIDASAPVWELTTFVDTDGILKVNANFARDILFRMGKDFTTLSIPVGAEYSLLTGFINLPAAQGGDRGIVANIDPELFSIGGSGQLLFPKIQNNINYDIDVRLTGNVGTTGNIREYIVYGMRHIEGTTTFTSRDIMYSGGVLQAKNHLHSTYTNNLSDPYIVGGVRFMLNNTSGNVITLTRIDLIVKGRR